MLLNVTCLWGHSGWDWDSRLDFTFTLVASEEPNDLQRIRFMIRNIFHHHGNDLSCSPMLPFLSPASIHKILTTVFLCQVNPLRQQQMSNNGKCKTDIRFLCMFALYKQQMSLSSGFTAFVEFLHTDLTVLFYNNFFPITSF